MAKLTSVAGFKVGSDASVHAWPVDTLEKALFHFVDAIMTNKQITMGIREGFRDEQCWQKNDHSARFKLPFDAAPNDVIFNKTIICEKCYE